MTTNVFDILKQCDDAYFNGDEPILSDAEYDKMRREAFKASPEHSYFVQIGSDVRGGKIKLPYTMGSLNQIYEGEVGHWVNKYSLQEKSIVITDKLDGTSCMIVYNNGKFSIAYSRGNGIEGADNTRHVKHMPSLPLTVPHNYLVVRAECIMKNDTFNTKYASEYKNPRNMVAGMLNRKETDVDILEDIDLIAYEIVSSDAGLEKLNKLDMLNELKSLGFLVAENTIADGGDLTDDMLSNALCARRGASKYELDGLVLTVDEHSSLELLSSSSSLNPEHSVKYKILTADAIVDAVVTDVLWEISKSGFIKPRVEIFPVELFGTTVKYASGFNAKFIIDNGIGKGAKIKITKSGMVIPYIVSVESKTLPTLPDKSIFGEWTMNESGVEATVPQDHEAVIFKQVLDFFETYKVDLLKEATLKSVWNSLHNKTYDEAIIEIASLIAPEWKNLVGANGVKIYDSMQTRLGGSGPEIFLGASKYMGIGFGVRKAKALLKGNTNNVIDFLNSLTEESIIEKEGFDVKTASMVIDGIPATLSLMEKMLDMGLIAFAETSQHTGNYDLEHLNVVMTGFRDSSLQDSIESRGGKVSSGVSKKTTHLLCMDVNSGSSKMQKAKDQGVVIMTPDEFKLEYGL